MDGEYIISINGIGVYLLFYQNAFPGCSISLQWRIIFT